MSVYSGKSALVTGASAGLGEHFALQLADLGVSRLTILARRADRLEKLKGRLLAQHPSLQVEIVTADLSDAGTLRGVLDQFDSTATTFDILINNAGFGDLGTFETSDPARIEGMLALNVVALTRLTRWALDGMLKKRSGWLCNVGSTAGLIPLPSFAVYGGTKAYVNSFSEALRVELHGSGISVLALCPGPVETEFGQVASRANSQRQFAPPRFLCVAPEEVVRETLHVLARGGGRLIPGILVRLPMLLAEEAPRFFLRFVFDFMGGQFRRERTARS